jgi:serine/threonine protein phosphatase PrpC
MAEEENPYAFSDETLPVLRPRDLERSRPRPRPMDVAGRSDIGNVREQNEDTFLIADLGRWLDVRETSLAVPEPARRVPGSQGTLLMVADGMGGHGGGDVASAVAVDMVAQFALYSMPYVAAQPDEAEEKELLEKLGDAMSQCQARLEQVALRKRMEHHRMGTTLTIAYALYPKLYIAHAGDSRCYLWRDGELVQITRDHTVGQALRDSGAIGSGPSRFDHVLVNVVGGGGERVRADAHSLLLAPGDKLLLCSDGLTGHVSDGEIAAELDLRESAAETCERLIAKAKADGGLDNITVIAAHFS